MIGFLVGKRTFAISILIALCIGLSLASWVKIPIEVMPKENVPPFLFLHVDAKEAMSPERMELALTLPVEGVIRTVSGLMKFTSNTNGRGVNLSLTYKPQTNMDLAEFSLLEALQDLETKGLIDMRGVSVSRVNPEVPAVIKLSLTYDSGLSDPAKTIKEDLRLGLEAIPEISKVEINGIEPLLFEYNIPAFKAQEFGLEGDGLTAFLNFQPLREPMGEAGFGSDRYLTAVNARLILNDLSQLQGQTIGRSSTFTLKEIASERVIDKSKVEISHKNGQNAVFIEIFSKDGANLFDLNNHLLDFIEKTKKENDVLGRVKFETIFNKTDDLKKAINDVFRSLYEAMLITFGIVFLFLRKARPTILISMTIPMTLLITILVLYQRGTSLNILTLSGLILGIGMVVDSAVLVVERIGELRKLGFAPRQAAAEGATDVTSALVMSTLTNAAIFLPVAFIEGGDSFTEILKAFQLPIVASLGASLIVALLFLPVAMIHWKDNLAKQKPVKTSQGVATESSEKILHAFRWLQKRRLVSGALTLLMVTATAGFVSDINETDIETPRDNYSTLNTKFTAETKPEDRRILFEKLEKEVLAQQKILGFRFIVADFNPQYLNGSILVFPEPSDDPDQSIQTQEIKLKNFLADFQLAPGFQAVLGFGITNAAGGSTALAPMDAFRFTGPKMARLTQLTEEMKVHLKNISGIESVRLDREENGERNMIFIPNEPVILAYGLDLSAISKEISTVMSSASVSNLNLNGKNVGARISFVPEGNFWTIDSLRQVKIRVAEGKYVNLMDLGSVTPMMFTRSVNRTDGIATGKLFVYYRTDGTAQALAETQSAVRKMIADFHFPHGYGPQKTESTARIEDMQNKSQFIIYLSMLLIYLLLASMFESVLLPFAILFTVPLALIFGVAGLKIMGLDLDVMARLSLVILVGIGVNGAIILIDLIEKLRSQGMRREDAVVVGCAQRFKAVVMTAAIQIISVLPVALGKSKIMGIPYSSLGVSIISGMLLSTVVTLIVLPMIYEWLDTIEGRLKGLLGINAGGKPNLVTQNDEIKSFTESKIDQARAA